MPTCLCNKECSTFIKYETSISGTTTTTTTTTTPNRQITKLRIYKCPVNEYTLDSKLEEFEETGNANCKYEERIIISTDDSYNCVPSNIKIETPLQLTETISSPNSNSIDLNRLSSLITYFDIEQRHSTLQVLETIIPKTSPAEITEEYIERIKSTLPLSLSLPTEVISGTPAI